MRRWWNSWKNPSSTTAIANSAALVEKGKKCDVTTLQSYLREAENGNVDAKYRLAFYSLTQPDDTKFAMQYMPNPIKAFEELALAGHVPAQLEFARLLMSGWPDPSQSQSAPILLADRSQAIAWLEKIAALDPLPARTDPQWGMVLEAVVHLRLLYFEKGDIALAHTYLKRGAEAGDVTSLFVLANWYQTGQFSEFVPQNDAKAFGLYQFIAEKAGLVLAFHNLAICYLTGQGCEPNARLAVEYFERASVKGYLPSKFNLANLYAEGRLVEKDVAQALLLYTEIFTSEVSNVDELKKNAMDAKKSLEQDMARARE